MHRWNLPPAVRRFFGWPTLGGWLTIGNCLGWAAYAFRLATPQGHDPDGFARVAGALGFLSISLPLATPFWLPGLDWHPRADELVAMAVMAGANSIVWGYGLAWCFRKLMATNAENG